jgi:peptidoglycan/LPS O-acetylase OafA/YrhL
MTTPTPHLSHPKYRPDIDGLRAVAVLSVVAFHAFPAWMKGGFIGVDVFFVISGFLISTIIFENLDRGTFSFTEFYARRIKRIFPALLLVLIASFAFGWFALLADEYKQLGKHIAAGAGFVSNLVLWSEAGYFDNSAETKPLLHLWSLGIEEQFYIIWPFVLWFAWKRKFNLLTLTVIVALISFGLNLKGIKQDSVATFYSPQTRFWELLSGSLLAWFAIYKNNAFQSYTLKIDGWLAKVIYREPVEADGKTLSNVVAFAGSLFLAYGFWRITKEVSFPGKWAVIPVLGAILIILAGPKAWINRKILSNKIAVWFGLISFPLYLWHWPLLSFARIVEGEVPSRNIRIAAVVLSIALAWLTYKFVERPIRLGGRNKLKVTSLIILMTIVGYVGYNAYSRDGLKFRQVVKTTEINAAAFSMPKIDSFRERCKSIVLKEHKGHCLVNGGNDDISQFATYFLGDSHSEALSLGLINSDVSFLSLGRGGCLPLVGVERFTENGPRQCESAYSTFFNKVVTSASKKSDVIVTARFSAYVEGTGFGEIDDKPRTPGNLHIQKPGIKIEKTESLYRDTFKVGLNDTLKVLTKSFNRVIFVLQVPELGFDPKACISRPFKMNRANCYVSKDEVLNRQKKYREALFEVLLSFPSVLVYDPLDLFCDASKCYAMRNGVMFYRDDDHISVAGANAVVSGLRSKGMLP